MTIKDILVHVETTPASKTRLMLTLRLARRFGARVTGVFILPILETPAPLGTSAAALVDHLAELRRAADRVGDDFLARVQGKGLEADWHTEIGPIASFIGRARAADLIILGQRDPNHTEALMAPEDVILACGRPVLLVPYAGTFDDAGAKVLIAWNGSREATRAVHEALPLMAAADEVTLLAPKPKDEPDDLLSQVARHLARHGLAPKLEPSVMQARSAADDILSRALDHEADLIVMGAYGHSRLREWILGGTTAAMLRQMTVPVLMAH